MVLDTRPKIRSRPGFAYEGHSRIKPLTNAVMCGGLSTLVGYSMHL